MALHDLNHAFACDFVAILNVGTLVAFGRPSEVLVPDVIEPIFQVVVHQIFSEQLNRSVLTFAKPGARP